MTFKAEGKSCAVNTSGGSHFQFGRTVIHALPRLENTLKTTAGALAVFYHSKHFHHHSVAWVWCAVLYRFGKRHTHTAGISESETVDSFLHNHAATTVKVRVSKHVYGCLAHRLVQWSVFIQMIAFEHEGHFQISLQLGNYSQKKVKHISAPVTWLRCYAVSPAGIDAIGAVFLIIEEIVGEYCGYLIFVAKHKKSCHGRMKLSGILILTHGTDTTQKHRVILFIP